MNTKFYFSIFVFLIMSCQAPLLENVDTLRSGEIPSPSVDSARALIDNWDWTANTYHTLYALSGVESGIVERPGIILPFFERTSSAGKYVGVTDTVAVTPDFVKQDGWVLVKRDFGSPTVAPVVPYFILYNRITGTLRVFVFTPNFGSPYELLKGELSLDSPSDVDKTTAQQLLTSNVDALTEESDYTLPEAPEAILSDSPMSYNSWSMLEFNVSNYVTGIEAMSNLGMAVTLYGFNSSDVTLDGTVDEWLKGSPAQSNLTLGNIASLAGKTISTFSKISDSSTIVENLQSWKDNHWLSNDMVWSDDSLAQFHARYGSSAVPTGARTTILGSIYNFFVKLESNAFISTLIQAVPFVPSILGLVNDFVGLFSTQEAVESGYRVKYNITLNGAITSTNLLSTIYFHIPGSASNENPAVGDMHKSAYNIPLGVFKISQLPTLKLVENDLLRKVTSWTHSEGNTYGEKLTNTKYVFAGIEDFQIDFNTAGLQNVDGVNYTPTVEASFLWEDAFLNTLVYHESLESSVYLPLDEFKSKFSLPANYLQKNIVDTSAAYSTYLSTGDIYDGNLQFIRTYERVTTVTPSRDLLTADFVPMLSIKVKLTPDVAGVTEKVIIRNFPLPVEYVYPQTSKMGLLEKSFPVNAGGSGMYYVYKSKYNHSSSPNTYTATITKSYGYLGYGYGYYWNSFTKDFILRNSGNSGLVMNTLYSDFTNTPSSISLGNGQDLPITLSVSTSTAGTLTKEWILETNDPSVPLWSYKTFSNKRLIVIKLQPTFN